jgi:hypothetical protein
MVRRRSVALPSLFPRPQSRRRDLTGRPLSSPVLPPPDHSASPYLSRLGWPLRFRWGIKRETLPWCCHYQVSLLSSSALPPLLFSPLASFGQPATSPSLSLLRPLAEQVVSPSSSTTSRRSSGEDREKNPNLHRRPCLSSWRCSSPSVGRL